MLVGFRVLNNMTQIDQVRELEEQVRQLCNRVTVTKGAEFESLLRELNTALNRWNNAKKAHEEKSAAT